MITSRHGLLVRIASLLTEPPAINRSVVVEALCAVLEEIAVGSAQAQGLAQYLPNLDKLLRALALLEDGIVAPMLQPRRPAHRSKDSTKREFHKLALVAGCMALEEIGVPPAEARREILALAARQRVRASGGKLARSTTLHTWRKKVHAHSLCRMVVQRLLIDRPTRRALIAKLEVMLRGEPPAGSLWKKAPRREELKLAS